MNWKAKLTDKHYQDAEDLHSYSNSILYAADGQSNGYEVKSKDEMIDNLDRIIKAAKAIKKSFRRS